MLELKHIVVTYGAVEVLHGVNLVVKEGEIVTLIGANGAGKTTTLLAVSGLLRPKDGKVLFQGEEISRMPAHQIVGRGISQSPEGRRIFPRLSVAENLDMGAYIRRDFSSIAMDRERVLSLFPVLAERLDQQGGTLSGGEQQMLAIARSLMARPRLLLLDEPSLGLAPLIVEKIFAVLKEINRQGVTIFLVEQNARMALELASRGYVMETGRVILDGESKSLLANDEVRRAYLGEG